MGKRITDPVEALAEKTAELVIDLVVRSLDVNALIKRVDPDAILDRVDVDRVLAKVDLDQVLARVDVDAVADRIDVNAIAQRIDLDVLATHTDLGAMIARSSGGVASDALDVVRGQAVGLDEWMARWVARLLGRDPPAQRPHFAGGVSRFVAYVVDLGVSAGVFMLALAAISFAASIFTGHSMARPWAWRCWG